MYTYATKKAMRFILSHNARVRQVISGSRKRPNYHENAAQQQVRGGHHVLPGQHSNDYARGEKNNKCQYWDNETKYGHSKTSRVKHGHMPRLPVCFQVRFRSVWKYDCWSEFVQINCDELYCNIQLHCALNLKHCSYSLWLIQFESS
jgi:hypothetical protein